MSRITIGIAVEREQVTAVAIRRGRLVWCGQRTLSADDLTSAIDTLVATVPRSWRDTLRIRVVISPAWCQFRRLGGLPGSLEPALARRAVEENCERFFLRTAAQLAVATPVRSANGSFTTTVFDASVIAAIRASRASVHCIGAAVAVVQHALAEQSGTTIEWAIDGEVVRVTLDAGVAVTAAVLMAGSAEASSRHHVLAPPLSGVGPTYAPAFAAAVAGWTDIPALRASDLRKNEQRLVSVRRIGIVAVLLMALVGWAVAPGLVAARVAREADRRERDLHVALSRVSRAVDRERQRLSLARQVSAFTASRRSMVSLLGQMTGVLPESTAIASIRVDSASGTLTVLSPRSMRALRGLAGLRAVEGVRVAGPVTREIIAGRELERMTVKFRLRQEK